MTFQKSPKTVKYLAGGGFRRLLWNEWTRLLLASMLTAFIVNPRSSVLNINTCNRVQIPLKDALVEDPLREQSKFTTASWDLMCDFMSNHSFQGYHEFIKQPSQCSKYSYDAILVSPGGVGSSTLFPNLTEVIGMKVNHPKDFDMLKHRLYPIEMDRLYKRMTRQKVNEGHCATKMFIYTYDQAAAAVFSLYRRNFHNSHNLKLHVTPFSDLCFPQTVKDYVASEIDFLNLEGHFMSWITGGLCWSDVPIVFLRSSYRLHLDSFEAVTKALHALHGIKGDFDLKYLQPDLKELRVMESHYAQEERRRDDFLKLQQFYSDFQNKLDSLGYLSIFFKGKHLRVV